MTDIELNMLYRVYNGASFQISNYFEPHELSYEDIIVFLVFNIDDGTKFYNLTKNVMIFDKPHSNDDFWFSKKHYIEDLIFEAL